MSYEPTPLDIEAGRDTPEKVRAHVLERSEYWRNQYNQTYTGRPRTKEEAESSKASLPQTTMRGGHVDRRTTAERMQSLFSHYGGVPGQRTSDDAE